MKAEQHPLLDQCATGSNLERYVTIKTAAREIGCPPWKIQRAVKDGLVPHYTFLNSRKLVVVSELRAVIDATRMGGAR